MSIKYISQKTLRYCEVQIKLIRVRLVATSRKFSNGLENFK